VAGGSLARQPNNADKAGADLRGREPRGCRRGMFIYRPDQYESDTLKQNIAEIIIAKHRNGPVGSVELVFRKPLAKFENAARRDTPVPAG
jgi:hypothetical protein